MVWHDVVCIYNIRVNMNEYAFASRLVSIPPMGRSKSDFVLRLGSGSVGGVVTCLPYRSVRQWFRLLLYYFLLDVIGVVFLFFSHYSYEFTSYKLWLHKLYVLKLMCFLICFVLFSHGFFRISIPTKLHKVLAACVVQCSCRCCCQWNRCLSSGMLGDDSCYLV